MVPVGSSRQVVDRPRGTPSDPASRSPSRTHRSQRNTIPEGGPSGSAARASSAPLTHAQTSRDGPWSPAKRSLYASAARSPSPSVPPRNSRRTHRPARSRQETGAPSGPVAANPSKSPAQPGDCVGAAVDPSRPVGTAGGIGTLVGMPPPEMPRHARRAMAAERIGRSSLAGDGRPRGRVRPSTRFAWRRVRVSPRHANARETSMPGTLDARARQDPGPGARTGTRAGTSRTGAESAQKSPCAVGQPESHTIGSSESGRPDGRTHDSTHAGIYGCAPRRCGAVCSSTEELPPPPARHRRDQPFDRADPQALHLRAGLGLGKGSRHRCRQGCCDSILRLIKVSTGHRV